MKLFWSIDFKYFQIENQETTSHPISTHADLFLFPSAISICIHDNKARKVSKNSRNDVSRAGLGAAEIFWSVSAEKVVSISSKKVKVNNRSFMFKIIIIFQ